MAFGSNRAMYGRPSTRNATARSERRRAASKRSRGRREYSNMDRTPDSSGAGERCRIGSGDRRAPSIGADAGSGWTMPRV
jgi:hypothetical protein